MTIITFGYRYNHAQPLAVDFILDCRCIVTDPAERKELGPLTGLDRAVQDYLRSQQSVMNLIHAGVRAVADGTIRRMAVGCNSGRHRSVYIAERMAESLRALSIEVRVSHLDMDRTPTTADKAKEVV